MWPLFESFVPIISAFCLSFMANTNVAFFSPLYPRSLDKSLYAVLGFELFFFVHSTLFVKWITKFSFVQMHVHRISGALHQWDCLRFLQWRVKNEAAEKIHEKMSLLFIKFSNKHVFYLRDNLKFPLFECNALQWIVASRPTFRMCITVRISTIRSDFVVRGR